MDPAAPVAPPHVHLEETTPWVRRWLRLEGVLAFAWGVILWILLNQPLPLFLVLLLVPDVSMVGYLRGPHLGAILYNLVHNWATAGLVLLLGLVAQSGLVTLAGVVLLAHTGIDRALGYGLKYPTTFQDTHLGRIGRGRR
ncbi:MAG TPA: DUF4260 family protein [Candidatus Limnocylindrales bacterium]|nr:DUF4260 family protein [Candidatus Limnocylindrales bacterium]